MSKRKGRKHSSKKTIPKTQVNNTAEDAVSLPNNKGMFDQVISNGWVQNSGIALVLAVIGLGVALYTRQQVNAAIISAAGVGTVFIWIVAIVALRHSTGPPATTRPEVSATADKGERKTVADTAIFMETRLVSLPLTIQPNETAHIVSLNKRRITSKNAVNWGFYDVYNDGITAKQWPDQAVIGKATQAHNPALFAWKAEVSNHGPNTVIDLSIPIKLWFENEKPEVIYNAIVTPLEAGKAFTFYLVNDCKKSVSAVWPDTAKLQVIGESERREVPLRRTFRSPIDQIMMFFASSTRLVGDHPCETE